MTVSSIAELESALMSELNSAMNDAAVDIWVDTKDEVKKFYSQGEPLKQYSRTGKLGETPDVTDIATGGKSVSFEVYLRTDFGYSTGTFSMAQVQTNAEAGTAGIKGKPGFWASAEEKMEKTFENIMRKHFPG